MEQTDLPPEINSNKTTDSSNTNPPVKSTFTPGAMLQALSEAVRNGVLSSAQAKDIRLSYGVSQSTFTRKTPNRALAKSRRQMQKTSRRKNRGAVKGQKRSGGTYAMTQANK